MPDTVGDYLNIAAQLEALDEEEKIKALRQILLQRGEADRLGNYGRDISAARLSEAFEKAKWLGMQRLMEDRKG